MLSLDFVVIFSHLRSREVSHDAPIMPVCGLLCVLQDSVKIQWRSSAGTTPRFRTCMAMTSSRGSYCGNLLGRPFFANATLGEQLVINHLILWVSPGSVFIADASLGESSNHFARLLGVMRVNLALGDSLSSAVPPDQKKHLERQ